MKTTDNRDLKRVKVIFRVFLIFCAFTTSLMLLLSVRSSNKALESRKLTQYEAPPTKQTFDFVVNDLNDLKKKKIAKLKRAEFDEKVRKTEAIFAKHGGYLSGYGELIVRKAEECGADYRYIVAIAGNESGFGRINYKLYNPFGYLDGVQYESYEHALGTITCHIARRFLVPCNHDLECVVSTYGGSDTDKPKWVWNINFFIRMVDSM